MKLLTKKNLWVYVVLAALLFGGVIGGQDPKPSSILPSTSQSPEELDEAEELEAEQTPEAEISPSPSVKPIRTKAIRALEKIAIKGRAPKTGYSRELFADDWDYSFGCDTRNKILRRDLVEYRYRSDSSCIIESGTLQDPYTGKTISFIRGVSTSLAVQIDHVVALSDAWQKGAQKLTAFERYQFYNDPLNLLAVDGPANSQKSDSDAASWLPSNKSFRCKYVARQIAVKLKYGLWVTEAEHQSMRRVLEACPKQAIPNS